jgi:hypothetical protein
VHCERGAAARRCRSRAQMRTTVRGREARENVLWHCCRCCVFGEHAATWLVVTEDNRAHFVSACRASQHRVHFDLATCVRGGTNSSHTAQVLHSRVHPSIPREYHYLTSSFKKFQMKPHPFHLPSKKVLSSASLQRL